MIPRIKHFINSKYRLFSGCFWFILRLGFSFLVFPSQELWDLALQQIQEIFLLCTPAASRSHPHQTMQRENLHFIGKLFWYWLTLKSKRQKILHSLLLLLYLDKLHLLNLSDNQCFVSKWNFNICRLCLKFWSDLEKNEWISELREIYL